VPVRQIASGVAAGILDRKRLPLARHPRRETRVWIEPVAKQLDAVVAIGDLYRFDRFAAPAELWDDLQARFPELLNAREPSQSRLLPRQGGRPERTHLSAVNSNGWGALTRAPRLLRRRMPGND
jgi:hypothetical protein